MKVSVYFSALRDMKDSGEPGCILLMQDGSQFWGVGRNPDYGAGPDTLPDSGAWFSLETFVPSSRASIWALPTGIHSVDIVIDVRAVIAIIPR